MTTIMANCSGNWMRAVTGPRVWPAPDVALTPATCYPVYPVMAARGPLPEGGRVFDLQSYCFRHEPSEDPARMQMFRIRSLSGPEPRTRS